MTNEERLAKLEKLQAEIKEATKREAKEIKEIMKADKADQFFYLMQGCFPKLGKDAILYYKKEENIIIPATEIEVDKIAAAGGARVEIIFPFFLENQKAVIKLLENSYNIYSVTVKPSKVVNWKFSTIFASVTKPEGAFSIPATITLEAYGKKKIEHVFLHDDGYTTERDIAKNNLYSFDEDKINNTVPNVELVALYWNYRKDPYVLRKEYKNLDENLFKVIFSECIMKDEEVIEFVKKYKIGFPNHLSKAKNNSVSAIIFNKSRISSKDCLYTAQEVDNIFNELIELFDKHIKNFYE